VDALNAEKATQKPLVWPNYGPVSAVPKPRRVSRNSEETQQPEKEPSPPKWQALWLATLAVVSMTGCASSSTQTFVKAEVPVSLSEPCPPLPSLDGSVFLWAREVVRMYHECAAKHASLVEAVK
jgi:hypothetical protein